MIRVKKAEVIERMTEGTESCRLLSTPSIYGESTLFLDMKDGAELYKECEKAVTKKLGRCVVVMADNEEQGLVAITYINCILNEKNRSSYMCDDDYDDEYDEWDEYEMDEDEDILDYLETGTLIPIVDFREANMRINHETHMPFPIYDQSAVSHMHDETKNPYWLRYETVPIIIVKDENDNCSTGFSHLDDKIVNRLSVTRRVFYLVIRENETLHRRLELFFDPDDMDDNGVSFARFLMEHTADLINVSSDKAEEERYSLGLFKSWLEEYSMKVTPPEDMDEVVKSIISINDTYPMTAMDKTLKYIRHLEPKTDQLSLETLRKFGLIAPAKTEMAGDTSLDKLVGLERIKDEVQGIVQYTKFYKDMLRKGKMKGELHNVYMFVGAPGTAKTTVAKELGRKMKKAGILKRDRFISITGAQLKDKFVGWTAPKVKEIFEKNDIILIDEAYSLTSNNHGEIDTFAQEALAQLAIELEEHSSDKVVIFAGYGGDVSERDNKMEEFLRANPGIKSRISACIVFDSYSGEEMLSIVHSIAHEKGLNMVHTADNEIVHYFNERNRSDTFGNGREARNFVDSTLKRVAMRYNPSKPVTKSACTITKRDILETLDCLRREPGRLNRVSKYGF